MLRCKKMEQSFVEIIIAPFLGVKILISVHQIYILVGFTSKMNKIEDFFCVFIHDHKYLDMIIE